MLAELTSNNSYFTTVWPTLQRLLSRCPLWLSSRHLPSKLGSQLALSTSNIPDDSNYFLTWRYNLAAHPRGQYQMLGNKMISSELLLNYSVNASHSLCPAAPILTVKLVILSFYLVSVTCFMLRGLHFVDGTFSTNQSSVSDQQPIGSLLVNTEEMQLLMW